MLNILIFKFVMGLKRRASSNKMIAFCGGLFTSSEHILRAAINIHTCSIMHWRLYFTCSCFLCCGWLYMYWREVVREVSSYRFHANIAFLEMNVIAQS